MHYSTDLVKIRSLDEVEWEKTTYVILKTVLVRWNWHISEN